MGRRQRRQPSRRHRLDNTAPLPDLTAEFPKRPGSCEQFVTARHPRFGPSPSSSLVILKTHAQSGQVRLVNVLARCHILCLEHTNKAWTGADRMQRLRFDPSTGHWRPKVTRLAFRFFNRTYSGVLRG
jgi:hypothetical protein